MLELVIGFFLVTGVSMMFFQVMHRFRKESTFNSENYLASSLVEKVLEQCYQESQLNPHGMKAIGLADADGAPYEVSTGITDRETVFFSNPGITETRTPDLHQVLKDNYVLSVETVREDGFYDVEASFKWKAETGKGQTLSSSRVFSFTGEKEVLTTWSMTDDEVRDRLVKDIFNDPGANLGAKVSSIGAQTMLVHIGHIFYSSIDCLRSPDFKQRLQQAETLEANTQTDSDQFLLCSQLYFDMARDLLHLMMSMQPHIKAAADNISFLPNMQLPERFIAESRIARGGLYYRQLRRIFLNCLLKLSERYEKQLRHADLQKRQRLLVGRLFNINRILYANRAYSEEISPAVIEARYEKLLDITQNYFRDKDPSIFRMAAQERGFIANNSLPQNFFVLRLTGKLFKEIDDYVNVLD
jgi:hypothetical protein